MSPLSLLVGRPQIGVRCGPFASSWCSDGDLHFVEAVQTFDDARTCVRELGKVWPGEYIIDNEETGERVFVSTRDGTKN
jgi:hypothetical protein